MMTIDQMRNLTVALRQSSDFAYMQAHRPSVNARDQRFWTGKAEGLNEASNLIAAQIRKAKGEQE